MKLCRAQILLEKSQYEMLTQIAQAESRSLSDVVREMIERELRYRQHCQMWLAARELQSDYSADSELTVFTGLDGEDLIRQPSTRLQIP